MVKLNGTGAIQWEKLLGGSGEDTGMPSSRPATADTSSWEIRTSSQNGDVTDTNHGGCDLWVVKLDGAGGIQWQ